MELRDLLAEVDKLMRGAEVQLIASLTFDLQMMTMMPQAYERSRGTIDWFSS